MTTLNAVFRVNGDASDDTLNINYFGPIAPNQDSAFTFVLNGGDGDDRLRFILADYAPERGGVYGRLNGGNGTDTMELDFTGANSVRSKVNADGSVTYGFDAGSGSDTLRGSFTADSTVERIIIKGSANADIFHGGTGNDFFDGNGGADTFYGSAGNDGYVFRDAGSRVIGEVAGGGIDSIFTYVTVDLRQQGSVENLRLSGTDAINGTGNELDNLISGNSANNVITGGLGNDALYGKGGADTFVFNEYGAANRDNIWDFDSNDTIQLNSSVFTGLQTNNDGTLAASSFHIGAEATGSSAQIVYNNATGVVSYDADGAGGQAAQDIAYIGKAGFFDASHIIVA